MQIYHDLLQEILDNGIQKGDRTGTGTKSIFGHEMRIDLSKGFPLLTTKRMPFRLISSELIWFIKGDTNIRYLLKYNNNIWNEWAFKRWVESSEYTGPDMTDFGRRSQIDPEFNKDYEFEMNCFILKILADNDFAEKYGELGDVYGKQWRDFGGIDQIADLIHQVKTNPNSRRMLVSAWNPPDVPASALPPCHYAFQLYVANNKLSLKFNMRSTDVFLGLPFNIASYALLTHMIAHVCDLEVGELIFSGGDVHIYSNHMEQVQEQLSREQRPLPTLVINPDVKDLFAFNVEDFTIEGYDPHPAIKAPVAV